jgi:hypothetical protein
VGVEYQHFIVPADRSWAPDAVGLAGLVDRLRTERWVLEPGHPSFAAQFRGGVIPEHRSTGGHALLPRRAAGARRLRDADIAVPLPVPLPASWIAERRHPASADALDDEMALVFPVEVPDDAFADFDAMGVRYPFTFGSDQALYHTLQIHLARDYVHHCSESLDRVDTDCRCGQSLSYDAEAVPSFVPAIRSGGRVRASCVRCGAAFEPRGHIAAYQPGFEGQRASQLDGGGLYRCAIIVDCGKGWPRNRGPLVLSPEFRACVEVAFGQPIVDFGELY